MLWPKILKSYSRGSFSGESPELLQTVSCLLPELRACGRQYLNEGVFQPSKLQSISANSVTWNLEDYVDPDYLDPEGNLVLYAVKGYDFYEYETYPVYCDYQYCWRGDEFNLISGELIRRVGVIASYNGEAVDEFDYYSSTGGLDLGATVYYLLDSPQISQIGAIPVREFSFNTTLETGTLENVNPWLIGQAWLRN